MTNEIIHGFDVKKIRNDFPILKTLVHDKPLVYLDNAATTQKPQAVIDKIAEYYNSYNSNIHRGVHLLSQKASEEYEMVRCKVQKFINAPSADEVIFTKGATDSINLLAYSLGKKFLKSGDEIIISTMEHHANIVPWQMLRDEIGIKLVIAPIDDNGELILSEFEALISNKTKIVSIVHVSNTLGTVNPINEITKIAKRKDVIVIVDAAQSIQHLKIDVQEIGCDFLVFSGHKLYAPTGVGVLWGKMDLLNTMPPYQTGGDMILSVSFDKTMFNEVPFKFEAGTQNIEGVIGLGAAIDYLSLIGLDKIKKYEDELFSFLRIELAKIDGLKFIGNAKHQSSACSFVLDSIHPHDLGTMLDMDGVAVRTGHHCTEPLMKRFKIPATTRASISFYNTKEEILILCESVNKAIKMFN